ncbi:TRAP transporter small permease [Chloroflexota bacterium]
MMGLWRAIETFANALDRMSTGIVVFFLIVMATLMFVVTVVRYFVVISFGWTEEVLGFLLAWSVFLLIGAAARRGEHIRVGFFLERFLGENRAKNVSTVVENVVGLAACSYFTWYGCKWVIWGFRHGLESWSAGGFYYALWIPWIIVPIGLGLISFFYLERCIGQLAHLVSRKTRQESTPQHEDNGNMST